VELLNHKSEIQFMGQRKFWLALSLALVLISFASLIFRGLNFGVDFTGGLLMEVSFDKSVDLQALRTDLAEAGYADAQVQSFGGVNDALIRMMPRDETNSTDQGNALLKVLREIDSSAQLRRTEFVGPQVGRELAEKGGTALIFTLLMIMIYVMFRFQWKFSVGAVVALVHDVVITVGVFSLLQLPFDLTVIAALLAIIGYSLNDTIVVFDRIRENFRKIRGGDVASITNLSINETLGRTINTSVTVFIVVVVLFFFGGDALRGFSAALIIGVVVGTYSSIYIASALLLTLGFTREDLLVDKKIEDDGQP
jgi:preprotein translocase subunit SecF